MTGSKHENYELLNLIGYGLAKFDKEFVDAFGFSTKTAFYNHIISLEIADTVGTIKNRQDLFDPFFDNGRKGWWQKGDTYLHRKEHVDSLFGELDVVEFAYMVKSYIQNNTIVQAEKTQISPIAQSRFRQLQLTGREAEYYFMRNYRQVKDFEDGKLQDARFFGDGYDFQIQVQDKYFLAEIKGVRGLSGSVRLTEKEFLKASEYKSMYGLIVISNLENQPKLTALFNPVDNLTLSKSILETKQISYHTESISW